MIQIKEYITSQGRSPFARWFRKLPATHAARVNTALTRLSMGQSVDTKHVGDGVHEYRIHMRPGYRLYFGRAGSELIILLIGGDKSSQPRDIANAKRLWSEYRERNRSTRSSE